MMGDMANAGGTRSSGARWARVTIPALLVLAWLLAGMAGGPYFGRVEEVSSNDRTAYLPDSAEATEVQRRLAAFTDTEAVPAVVVFTAGEPLDEAAMETLNARVQDAAALDVVAGEVSPAIPSEDERAAQAFVPLSEEADLSEATTALRSALTKDLPEGVEVYVTGPAGFSSDLSAAFAGIDGLLLAVALAAVFVILVIVYRSPLLPVLVLLTSMLALCAALLAVWWLAYSGAVLLNGQIQGILFILVIGAATDYALLYVARFREEMRTTGDRWTATKRAWRGAVEPILASGGTVIAGLLCLLLSQLRSNSALGPVASIGIVSAMLAALTLLPALLMLTGRAAFWPRIPRPDAPARTRRGLWDRIAGLVSARPRTLWIGTAAVLAAGCLAVPQLQASGVPQSALVLGSSEARAGQEALAEHFPAGAGTPVYVVVPQDALQDGADVLLANDGIAQAAVTADSPSGSAPVTDEGVTAQGPPGTPTAEPVIAGGEVLLQGTLTDAPDSAGAEQTVRELRKAYASAVPEALVGGETATDLDTNEASIHDRTLIVPLVLVVILLILMLLLRAVIAPVLLVGTTVLSFGTAMGVSALVFNGVFDFPGADPSVPLYGFVFLVALGIDYNIFLMTRVREETIAHGTHQGVLRGLRLTGGIITSAGLVLAATFTALAVIPILFLVQLAFIVAFGVLLDALVVRSLLVPALAYDLGRVIWWPSQLSRGRH
ncbi:efflux RND transporter permease subunit [Sediminivirga luteola]|uniref:Membrane protein n=2 Tax=Sediminivirga luteola TaxID=1774748 RepID=A0A8J2XJU7_9MICO|nr:membrane protein [Sediminivirga luteola]